jgi:phage terminase Nu1 subunit (DNA packaging protein)
MAAKNSDRIVDRTELGKFLNVDADYVSVLVREGMPKVHHGRYALVRCLSWYVKHLQDSVKKRGLRVPGDLSERECKLRIVKATAEMREYELGRVKRELIPAPEVEARWMEIAATIKSRLLAIGSRTSPMIVGQTDRMFIQRVIDDAIREALFALAGSGIPESGKPPSPDRASAAAD